MDTSFKDYTFFQIDTVEMALDHPEYKKHKESMDGWVLDFLESGTPMQVKTIAKLSGKDIQTALTSVHSLWNVGIINTVMSYLAIGTYNDETWHINFIIDDAQKVADLLAQEKGKYPKNIVIVRNGVDGPVVKELKGWTPKLPATLEKIWEEQSEFSQNTFGSDNIKGPIGSLKHLAKEAVEAQEKPEDKEEYADCFLLILDAARRGKISYQELLDIAYNKLQKNKNRKWPPINIGNIDEDIGHINESL